MAIKSGTLQVVEFWPDIKLLMLPIQLKMRFRGRGSFNNDAADFNLIVKTNIYVIAFKLTLISHLELN